MSDTDSQRGNRPRPTWLLEPCPHWCTRQHLEDDHIEDRKHQDDGISFAAILGRVDPLTMRTVGAVGEIVVQRYQTVSDASSWVVIRSADSDETLIVAWSAVPALHRALSGEL